MMRLLKIFAAKQPAQYCFAIAFTGWMLCSVAFAADMHPRSPANPILPLPPTLEASETVTSTAAPELIAHELSTPELTAPLPSPTAIPLPTPTAVSTPTQAPATAVPSPQKPSGESLHQAVRRLKLPLPLPGARIVVTKSARRLDLYSGKTRVKSYRVALGPRPTGHKQQQGDGRTPEGQFYICTRNTSTSAFHIFLGLSYPALPDATQAAQKKIISWREYQLIRQRLSARAAPLWRTRLGGWVGIHGGTDASFAQRKMKQRGTRDWTAGCIALTNREINEIYLATRLGTPVLVRP